MVHYLPYDADTPKCVFPGEYSNSYLVFDDLKKLMNFCSLFNVKAMVGSIGCTQPTYYIYFWITTLLCTIGLDNVLQATYRFLYKNKNMFIHL